MAEHSMLNLVPLAGAGRKARFRQSPAVDD
jgi:hypothetical protein